MFSSWVQLIELKLSDCEQGMPWTNRCIASIITYLSSQNSTD